MKFTLSWLKDHLETHLSLEELGQLLTSIGHEIESIEDPSARLEGFVVGHVVEAEPHPNADRLRVCKVKIAEEAAPIQVVCGAPNARAGMKGVFVSPGQTIPHSGDVLKAGQIRGEVSNGMLCSERELMLGDDHDGIIDLPVETPIGLPAAQALGLDDPLIEIELTPNRGDCTGVYGIARDLAAAGAGNLKPLHSGTAAAASIQGGYASPIRVHLEAKDPLACSYFVGRHFRGLKNQESPEWLKQRLTAIGLRPISALVDITNYMSFDHGRPLHVFDAAKVKGDIRVRFAQVGETLEALDGKTYNLNDSMTVITDESGPLGLGGIMGGEESGCSEQTTEVFLEIAYFDPVRTSKTGQALSLISDARYRFERGVDPEFMMDAAELTTQLILELCGGECSELVVAGGPPAARAPILWQPEMLRNFGGLDLETDMQLDLLKRLGFGVSGSGPYDIFIPSWRRQFDAAPDIVEEILRLVGYDRVPAVSLPAVGWQRASNPLQKRESLARRCLAGRGLKECVTWSFISHEDADRFGAAKSKAALTIENPIASDLAVMRGTCLSNLARAAIQNARSGRPNAALFEVGPVYHGPRPEEQSSSVAVVRSGNFVTRRWNAADREVDAYDIKADLAAVARCLGAPVDRFQIEDMEPNAAFHPGRSAVFKLGPKIVAQFGELHPAAVQAMGGAGRYVMGELNLNALPLPRQKGTTRPNWQPSLLQPVQRDFAFILGRDQKSIDVTRAILGSDKTYITDVTLFDVYEGDRLTEGQKSLAYTVTLQPKAQAFTEDEIKALSERIVANVLKRTGAQLRS